MGEQRLSAPCRAGEPNGGGDLALARLVGLSVPAGVRTNYELRVPAAHVAARVAVLDPLIPDPVRSFVEWSLVPRATHLAEAAGLTVLDEPEWY